MPGIEQFIQKVLDTRVSRRDAVLGGAAVTGAVTALGAERAISRFFPPTPEPEDVPSIGKNFRFALIINSGVHIRTSPRIPDKTRFHQGNNVIDWQDIQAVNGVPLEGDTFVLNEPVIVNGAPVSRRQTLWPDPSSPDAKVTPTFESDDYEWVKVHILKKGANKEMPGYMNLLGSGKNVVLLNTYTYGIAANYSRIYDTVLIPSSPDRIARDTVPQIWSAYADRKLTPLVFQDGSSISMLAKGETIVPEAKIIPAADNLAQLEQMKKDRTLIRVRNFPDVQYSNEEPVDIVGFLPQGNSIKNVLVQGGNPNNSWAVFRVEDINGGLVDKDGHYFPMDPKQIVTVHDSFLDYKLPQGAT